MAKAESTIYKFCRPEHNIALNSRTLRLGTLHEYRNIEQSEIVDADEGTFKIDLDFQGRPVTPDAVSILTTHLADSFSIEGGDMNGNTGVMKLGKIKLNTSLSDCWILSMSFAKRTDVPSLAELYKSSWGISGNDAIQNFLHAIRERLLHSICLDDLQGKIGEIPISKLQSSFSIRCHAGSVCYMDRIHVASPETFTSADAIRLINKIPFIKPKRFEEEKEYRIALAPEIGGKTVPIKPKAKILDLGSIFGVSILETE